MSDDLYEDGQVGHLAHPLWGNTLNLLVDRISGLQIVVL